MLRFYQVVLLLILLVSACGSKKEIKSPPQPPPTSEIQPKGIPSVSLDFIQGKFDPKTHPDFIKIDEKYADKADQYLQRRAYEAFIAMHNAAMKEGIQLVIRSATRDFYRQKEIWEAKWKGDRLVDGGENLAKTTPDSVTRALKILRWSSMPGSSRHHWGTDIDLNEFENSYFESGQGKEEYNWLVKKAASFGFCQPYTAKGEARPYGYNEEKWHWSYIPLAQDYISVATTYLRNADITGFAGSSTAEAIDVKQKFILGIDLQCFKEFEN